MTVHRSCESVREVLARYEAFSMGNPFAQIACLTSHKLPVSEPMGIALRKACHAMGYADEECFYISVSAPWSEFELCLETLDPLGIIALDADCAPVLARFMKVPALKVGDYLSAQGRACVVLEDFERALDDEEHKRVAWHQMRKLQR